LLFENIFVEQKMKKYWEIIEWTVIFTVILTLIGSAIGVKTLIGAIVLSTSFSLLINWVQSKRRRSW